VSYQHSTTGFKIEIFVPKWPLGQRAIFSAIHLPRTLGQRAPGGPGAA
jgi:hypothetical protein